MNWKRIRGVYGKPWSKMSKVELNPQILRRVGEILVESVSEEARKAVVAQAGRTPEGQPMGLPNTPDFYNSFSYRISGPSSLEILSSWPWVERHVEGRDPFPMTWLTQAAGRTLIPLKQPDGSVIIRMAPKTEEEAWIHPGVRKYSFLEVGVRKGREKAARVLAEEALRQILKGDPRR